MNSRIIYSAEWPRPQDFPVETVLLYDSVLDKKSDFRGWSRKFQYRVPLKAGETLKTLASLQAVLKKITALKVSQTTQMTFLAVGGGSIGDFSGFLASIFLRGRNLILMPSTWLSAVDSSHGGKTGLNFENVKNQLGTFYPAQKIYIVYPLLKSQPPERLREAMGEIVKIAILSDRKVFSYLEKNATAVDADQVLRQLPSLVRLKYQIVNQDPLEKKGTRRLLNLGHTMGHVFESHFGWPHGTAVLAGIQFAARWSLQRALLSEKDFIRISLLLENIGVEVDLNQALKRMPLKKIKQLLARDKKLTSSAAMDFIFIRGIGRCVRQKVTLNDILKEIERQKEEY